MPTSRILLKRSGNVLIPRRRYLGGKMHEHVPAPVADNAAAMETGRKLSALHIARPKPITLRL